MWETWIQTLDWEDPLEKGMATHSTTLAWTISWTEELGSLQSKGLQGVGHNWETNTFTQAYPLEYFIQQKDGFIEQTQFSVAVEF